MSANPSDVSAIVCTLNSIGSVERCLQSLRNSAVEELIVVDGNSTDGTREVARSLADKFLTDGGLGLGAARNLGIQHATRQFILNMGSDNLMPPGQLQIMLDTLVKQDLAGVSAQTRIQGNNYFAKGLNAWRGGRFRPGPAKVIGTPTLFRANLLSAHPYDPSSRFSDDSELCERWARELDARFAISEAYVDEVSKATWEEVRIRCRMYGISDDEIFRRGRSSGWSISRSMRSLLHPLHADLIVPAVNLKPREALQNLPFLVIFAGLRYGYWANQAFAVRRFTNPTQP